MAQLMDSSNVGRPVAAPEDVIDKLPRTVLEVDCGFKPMLSLAFLKISSYSTVTFQELRGLQRFIHPEHGRS